jgi:hypothetical protein
VLMKIPKVLSKNKKPPVYAERQQSILNQLSTCDQEMFFKILRSVVELAQTVDPEQFATHGDGSNPTEPDPMCDQSYIKLDEVYDDPKISRFEAENLQLRDELSKLTIELKMSDERRQCEFEVSTRLFQKLSSLSPSSFAPTSLQDLRLQNFDLSQKNQIHMEALCELKIQRNNESREKDKIISELRRETRALQVSLNTCRSEEREEKVWLEKKLSEVEKDKKCQKKSIDEILEEKDLAEQGRVAAECQVKQYKKKFEYLKGKEVAVGGRDGDEAGFSRDALCVSKNLESQL